MGLSATSRVSRAFGIAKLPIVGGVTSYLDVNFLVYSLHESGTNAYLSLTLVEYPSLPWPNPVASTYNPFSQTVQTCPPYSTTATIRGTTAAPDFDEDGVSDHRRTNSIASLFAKVSPAFATMPSGSLSLTTTAANRPADRCDSDPTGSASSDSDGDTITGNWSDLFRPPGEQPEGRCLNINPGTADRTLTATGTNYADDLGKADAT
jgi:hypothetical protein